MKGYELIDASIIWQNGSRTYGGGKPADPPGTWPYPPPSGGTPVEVADETPAQMPNVNADVPQINKNPGAIPIGIMYGWQPIAPAPASVSDADFFGRFMSLVDTWKRLAAWGGGLDALAQKISAPLFENPYPKGALNDRVGPRTAMAIWKDIQSAGYDKAGSAADLRKGLAAPPFYTYGAPGISVEGLNALIAQLNDTAGRAAKAGWSTAPPYQPPSAPAPQASPPPSDTPPPSAPQDGGASPETPTSIASTLSDYSARAQGWWNGLSGTTKVVTGSLAVVAVVAVLSDPKR